jgi:hypothetical protein
VILLAAFVPSGPVTAREGRPLEVQFAHGPSSPPCLDRLETKFMLSEYIPAHGGVMPAEALYLEFVDLAEFDGI